MNFGLLFLTKENTNSPWIHFEAGALTKVIKESLICPILFEIEELETTSPLSQFQGIQYKKDTILNLIHQINDNALEQNQDLETINERFEHCWPRLSLSVEDALNLKAVEKDNEKQYSEPFTVKILKPRRYDWEIQVRKLKSKPDGLEMSLRTFGDGIGFLHNQIEGYQPSLDPDLYVGIRNVGGAMASLIAGRKGNFKKPVIIVRVDPITPSDPTTDKSPGHLFIEQCLFVGESDSNYTYKDELINSTLLERITRNRNKIKSILLFDQEIKSGSSLKSVIDNLKKEFPNAAQQIYVAILVASRVGQTVESELYEMLAKNTEFSIGREYLPDFLAFTNCGKRSKVYINGGKVD
jgi:hypothetical protein